jgi:hypothetical protein
MNEVIDVVCGDFVLGVPVLEAVVGGDGLKLVGVSAHDPRSRLRVMLPSNCDVKVRLHPEPS